MSCGSVELSWPLLEVPVLPQVGGGRGVGASHLLLCMWPWEARKDVLCTRQVAGWLLTSAPWTCH